ncbi:hypothetical protein M3Y94_00399900 [Aphelenchoides besseyi]|nr:hypothetical protein M3Y94_00399900 [Aphelenchoides besseyi]KAI6218456.1 UDENN domain-containing protein [Aphelenchoides besseyi]
MLMVNTGMFGDQKWVLRAVQHPEEPETRYNRHRKDVVTLFDVYCEVDGRGTNLPIIYSYPPDFGNQSILSLIPQFAFPCGKIDATNDGLDSAAVQQFTFVITEGTGNFTYAYCRFSPSSGICACILSGYCYHSLFYSLLNHLGMARAMRNGQENVEAILSNGYHLEVPEPGEKLVLSQVPKNLRFSGQIPSERVLSMLNNDKILMEFFNLVEDDQMIALFTALLFERRILITGSKFGQLTACCFALLKILYPFHWQYVFIPLFTTQMLEYLTMPMPYIIGIPKKIFESATDRQNWSEYVLFDLDTKVYESAQHERLPREVYDYLKQNLKVRSNSFHSDNFPRTFLRAFAMLFGRYKSGYIENTETHELVYNLERFVEKSRTSLQPFLRSVLIENGVSYFNGFVTDRLNPTTVHRTMDEEFEREITNIERNQYTRFLQTNTPEAFQNAVSNMKDNATEVIGSLKERMQGMSLKEKFRLTPKNRRKKKAQHIDPMSVDTSQFGVGMSNEWQEEEEGSSPRSADAEIEDELDLIDFSDPTPTKELNFDDFLKSNSGFTSTQPSTSAAPSSANLFALSKPNGITHQSTSSPSFQNWQKFD